jgi:hypothetical protein
MRPANERRLARIRLARREFPPVRMEPTRMVAGHKGKKAHECDCSS